MYISHVVKCRFEKTTKLMIDHPNEVMMREPITNLEYISTNTNCPIFLVTRLKELNQSLKGGLEAVSSTSQRWFLKE